MTRKTWFLILIMVSLLIGTTLATSACQHGFWASHANDHSSETEGLEPNRTEQASGTTPPAQPKKSQGELRQDWYQRIDRHNAWHTREDNLRLLGMKPVPLLTREGLPLSSALENTFRAMDGLIQDKPMDRLRMSVFGNSLIASDNIVRAIRDVFTHLYGSAGRGFLLMHPQLDKAPRRRTANGSWHWNIHKLVMDEKTKYPKGIGGLVNVSQGWKSYSRFHYTDEDVLKVFWWDHPWSPHWNTRIYSNDTLKQAPDYDKKAWPIKTVFRSKNKKTTHKGLAVTHVPLPEQTNKIRVGVHGKYGVYFGASLEDTNAHGAIVDTMGIIATDAEDWEHVDHDVYDGMMKSLAPNLVIHILGGNEIKKLAFRWKSLEQYQEAIPNWIARSKRALPNSDCLVVGPPQNIYRPGSKRDYKAAKIAGKNVWDTRATFYDIEPIFRQAAFDHGCAYLDMYTSMGGEEAFKKLHEQSWLQPDFIHPRRTGLDMMGQLISDAILNAYLGTDTDLK